LERARQVHCENKAIAPHNPSTLAHRHGLSSWRPNVEQIRRQHTAVAPQLRDCKSKARSQERHGKDTTPTRQSYNKNTAKTRQRQKAHGKAHGKDTANNRQRHGKDTAKTQQRDCKAHGTDAGGIRHPNYKYVIFHFKPTARQCRAGPRRNHGKHAANSNSITATAQRTQAKLCRQK
jgi:hypothetical protein